MTNAFAIPAYSQPVTLKVTGLSAATLQTWVNRRAIVLSEQNPGTGRRRLYSKLDVVKLAVMRRLHDLRLDLSVSKRVAEEAVIDLPKAGEIEWHLHLIMQPRTGKPAGVSIVGSSRSYPDFSVVVGDARELALADYTEAFEGLGPFDRRDRTKKGRPIDPVLRDRAARMGFHAEPITVVPLGEIVNGTLLRLKALDEEARAQ